MAGALPFSVHREDKSHSVFTEKIRNSPIRQGSKEATKLGNNRHLAKNGKD
jgi:hypothetical protein